jgi:hypothetical protein
MKATGTRITAAVVFVLIAICIIAADAQSRARATSSSSAGPVTQTVINVSDREKTVPYNKSASNTRVRSIRMVDFYLRDGTLISGKLVSENRNKVILEQLEGSKIIVATYSKREMEAKSLQVKNVSASKYYGDMAEYFAGRTWDFKDDPDDFIQAIRFYKRAKGLIEGDSQFDREKSKEIDSKVAELEADREVWTKQIETRAKLKKLEFQAEFEKRFAELDAKITASAKKIEKSIAQIDEVLADVKQNSEQLDKNIPAMEQDLRRRMDALGAEVENNRRLLDPYGRTRRNYGTRSRY